MKRRTLLGLPALVPAAAWLSACGSGSGGTASLRMVNASQGYASLDLYYQDSNSNLTKWISGVAYGTGSAYTSVTAGTDSIVFTNTGSTSSLLTQSRTLNGNTQYTVVTFTSQGSLKSVALADNVTAANSGQTKVSVLNEAGDSGALDIYLTGPNDNLATSSPIASNVLAGGSQTPYSVQTAGTYRLRVVGTGDITDLRLDVTGVALASTDVVTFVLTSGKSGVLVDAMQLNQGGTVTPLLNTQARVRVISSLADGSAVTVSVAGAFMNVGALPAVGSYALVTAGTGLAVTATVGANVVNGSLTANPGEDWTLLVEGATASVATVTLIADDYRLASNVANAKVRLINALAGSSPLTMTVNGVSVSTTGVSEGQASPYNINIVGATSASVQVLSSSGTLVSLPTLTEASPPLVAQHVYTMFMYGSVSSPQHLWTTDR